MQHDDDPDLCDPENEQDPVKNREIEVLRFSTEHLSDLLAKEISKNRDLRKQNEALRKISLESARGFTAVQQDLSEAIEFIQNLPMGTA